MDKMDSPERVLKVINHEEPDRVPSFESTFTNNSIMKHYGIPIEDVKYIKVPDKILKKVAENAKAFRKNYINYYKLFRIIGIDMYLSNTCFFPRKMLTDVKFIDEYGRIMQKEIYEKDGTVILGYIGGYFKSFEDYEDWEQPDPHWEARLNHFLLGREIQEEMKNEIFSIPFTSGLMEATWQGFGIETFSRMLTKPNQCRRIFDDKGKFTLELVKIFAENDAQLILIFDDYGYKNGLFMSPRNYRKYIFPWMKQICEGAHKRNCKIMLHSDGDLTEIFEDIVNCGVDVINPIEPTTANPEYDIFKLNEKYGDKITFAGNLSPMMLATGEISEIEDYSKRLFRELAPGGGYIFSSGHSINPAVTIDRFEAMHNIRKKFGNYPINVPD